MNRATLRSRLKREGFSDKPDAELNDLLQEAYEAVLGEADWPSLRASTPETAAVSFGAPSVQLPTEVGKIIAVKLANEGGRKLAFISANDLISRRATGNPSAATLPASPAGDGAWFTWSPVAPKAGQRVELDGAASSSAFGLINTYEWDLDGDGEYETNTGESPYAEQTWNTNGAKSVSLRVTDEAGQTQTRTQTITIGAAQVDTEPLYWSIMGTEYIGTETRQVIQVYPEPVNPQTLEIYYYRHPNALEDDDDTPLFPTRYHRVILQYALYLAYREYYEDDSAAAKEAYGRYQGQVKRMVQDLTGEQLDKGEIAGDPHTLDGLIQQVKANSSSWNQDFGRSQLTLWINETILEISGRTNWPWLRATATVRTRTDSTSLAGLPDDLAKPRSLADARGTEIPWVEEDALSQYGLNRGSSRSPAVYTVVGQNGAGVPQLRVHPQQLQSVELTLDYLRSPATLQSPYDKPNIPERARQAVVLGATAKAARAVGDKQAGTWKAEYEDYLERMLGDLLEEQVDEPAYIHDTWEY